MLLWKPWWFIWFFTSVRPPLLFPPHPCCVAFSTCEMGTGVVYFMCLRCVLSWLLWERFTFLHYQFCNALRFVCGSFFKTSSAVGYVTLVLTRLRKWEQVGNCYCCCSIFRKANFFLLGFGEFVAWFLFENGKGHVNNWESKKMCAEGNLKPNTMLWCEYAYVYSVSCEKIPVGLLFLM